VECLIHLLLQLLQLFLSGALEVVATPLCEVLAAELSRDHGELYVRAIWAAKANGLRALGGRVLLCHFS